MDKAIDMFKRSSLEVELAAKEKEISQLVEDVQRLQASLNKLRESTSSQVSKLEEELASKNQAFKKLEEKIKSQDDYEEIKRELSVMKSIEFSGSQGKEGSVEEAKSLERLVLEKNKALQSENTTLKVNNADISDELSCVFCTFLPESSTPALSENTEAFASILGEEIVSSYRQSRISTPSTPSTNGDKKEMENGERTLPSKVSPKIERVPSIPSESPHLPPPPSPQFFQYGTGHLLSNYMGMGVIKSEQQTCNSQGIDTSLVAKTVRELLSIHNIGQRLFAKHVLGLSQGTVSELLSKPKSWDKLTEKGRESYRKMYAWATDERNILALKAISPKKGPTTLVSSVQREDAQTEERIAQILNEAQMAMQMKKAMEQAYPQTVAHAYQKEMMRLAQVSVYQGLPSPHSSSNSVTSPTGPGSILSERKPSVLENSRRRESVDSQGSAKEMVERIYKQELMKLAQAAESAGNIAASTMYQQELARLAQNVQREVFTEPGEIRRPRNSPEDMRIKTEPRDSSYDDTMMQSNGPIDLSKHSSSSTPSTPTSPPESDQSPSHHQASAFFQVKPKMNGHTTPVESKAFVPQFGQQTECVSPLQRMQNIANSLMARPHMAVSNAKPLKAVLPPITQDQFDKYGNMNTDDLVKKIKETLSQYSISQRLFGENVLGLSQGSVSDLLARPKPWHMLTQKGREPFIRMQIFLEDAEAIPKLVASQYHIPPDKLMRGRPPQEIVSPSSEKPPPSATHGIHGNRVSISSSAPPESTTPIRHHAPPSLHHPHHHHNHHHFPHPAHHFNHNPFSWASFSYPSSMLEVVAMTSEIDTLELTSRVKDVLQFHNLGQKLFGEAVLGLSQGSVSELLSKPKPWHMLSIKGREPFIKMHLWLSDPHNVERLKHYQNEVKAQRRRRSSLEERSYDSPSLPKRPRVFFTEEQKEKLRMAYSHDPYPNQNTIEALANELNVGVKTVINWFHNHRMRAKQQQHSGSGSVSSMGEYGSQIKSENNDDNSDQSDISSLSGDTGPYQSSFHGNEASQWLFPKFEPISALKRSSPLGGLENDDGEDNDDGVVEDDDSRSSRSNSPSPMGLDDESRQEIRAKIDGDKVFNDFGETSPAEDGEDLTASHLMQNMTQGSGVNKRKRSNPQYVSEGRQLDKTKTILDGLPSQVSRDEGVSLELDEDVEKENESGNIDQGYLSRDHVNKMAKLSHSVDSTEDDWDEFDRKSSIEKLQKNLQQTAVAGSWEF
ncbi:hypothetical protein FSP39_003291 [Pinctada imbricata]|uniref:Homeobox protein cut-like n=1 Tax=Pinctada imbricata TaxID=66713 RepID=A0AA89BHL4_PINIB|nr:hypothetical protein FSP39_003291 [Pinctada imbricata]